MNAARILVVERQGTQKKTGAKHEYWKVVADLRTCEERYQRLIDSIPETDESRLKSAVATLRSKVRQRKRLEAELLRAVETERERIGQDLHDDLCQRLGARAMMTSVIAERIGHKDRASGKQRATPSPNGGRTLLRHRAQAIPAEESSTAMPKPSLE
jgi:signal transduction histidine kinase